MGEGEFMNDKFSTLNIEHSILNIQHSTFLIPLSPSPPPPLPSSRSFTELHMLLGLDLDIKFFQMGNIILESVTL